MQYVRSLHNCSCVNFAKITPRTTSLSVKCVEVNTDRLTNRSVGTPAQVHIIPSTIHTGRAVTGPCAHPIQ